VTQRQLGWLTSWHLREETYGRALARLSTPNTTAPLAALFGSGTSSSSDGHELSLDRRAQAAGAVNPHKGTEPAVSFTATSRIATRRSIPQLSPPASEAAQVLDGLLHHGAPICTSKSITSMAGASPTMCSRYVICLGSGSRRIPNIAARRLHLFNGIEPGPDIAPLVAGRIDEGLIEAHWDDVLRLGTLDPHRRRQRLDHAGTARLLSTRQRLGTGVARDGVTSRFVRQTTISRT
jgi:TnpA family transposase